MRREKISLGSESRVRDWLTGSLTHNDGKLCYDK
jgi:hypothetical protein